jgi:cell pole-organizing protein PopZ
MTGQRGREPSMEDILASIRTIINQTEPAAPPAAAESVAPAPVAFTPPPPHAEDVLELTEQAPPPAAAPVLAPAPAAPRGPTLEETVRAMLAPMLKQWLDANLPAIVEDVAIREVRRLSGRE